MTQMTNQQQPSPALPYGHECVLRPPISAIRLTLALKEGPAYSHNEAGTEFGHRAGTRKAVGRSERLSTVFLWLWLSLERKRHMLFMISSTSCCLAFAWLPTRMTCGRWIWLRRYQSINGGKRKRLYER